jgi:hypothetical protein
VLSKSAVPQIAFYAHARHAPRRFKIKFGRERRTKIANKILPTRRSACRQLFRFWRYVSRHRTVAELRTPSVAAQKIMRANRRATMTELALLTGTGRLHINDKSVGVVIYSVHVWRDGETTGADGVLSGNPLIIEAARKNQVADLELEGGERIAVRVHEANMVRGLFKVSGPIPGY